MSSNEPDGGVDPDVDPDVDAPDADAPDADADEDEDADPYEEQSATSDYTPSTSNLEDMIAVDGEEEEEEEEETRVTRRGRAPRGGISSELEALPEDNEMLSTNLHTRRTMHYRGDDDDDDDDLDMHDSFATGDIIQSFRPPDQAAPAGEEKSQALVIAGESSLSTTNQEQDNLDDQQVLVPVTPGSTALALPEAIDASLVPYATNQEEDNVGGSQYLVHLAPGSMALSLPEAAENSPIPAIDNPHASPSALSTVLVPDGAQGAMVPVPSSSDAVTESTAIARRERRSVLAVGEEANNRLVVAGSNDDQALAVSSRDRTLSISSNDRTLALSSNDQTLAVSSNDQTLAVSSKDQTLAVSSKDQTLAVSSDEQQALAVSSNEQASVNSSNEQPSVNSSNEQPSVDSSNEQALAVSSNEQTLAVSSNEQALAVSSDEQALAVSSNEQTLAVSSDEQALAVSSNEQLSANSSNEQPLAVSSNEQTLADSSSKQALADTAHSKDSKDDSTGWENYDDKTLSSSVTDDVSLTVEDLYSHRDAGAPLQREERQPPKVETVPEDRTVESGDDWTKPYADEVIEDTFDDDSTINTYGSNYWNSKNPEKGANPDKGLKQPATIYEEDEEDGLSEQSRDLIQKPQHSMDASYSSASWKYGNQSVVSGSSQHTTSTRSSRAAPGVVQRPGSFRSSRRDASREVEVSMDGFMHQAKSVGGDSTVGSGMNQPLLVTSVGADKMSKLSKMYKYCTVLSIMCLMATVTFFAVHVGPFVERPSAKTNGNGNGNTASNQGASVGGTTAQFGALVADPLADERSSAAVFSSGANEDRKDNGIPQWMSHTFMKWRREYVGASSALPFIWTHEFTGGDIVAETLSKCLGKVVAGNGKKYDIGGVHSQAFNSDEFTVLSSSGHKFLNVDLFTPVGVNRAGSMGLIQSRVSHIACTPFLKESAENLFTSRTTQGFPEVAGRLLVVFRDPIDRALNRYKAARLFTGDESMTLEKFAMNEIYSENNPLTRGLLGILPTETLGPDQINLAKELIDQYILVGLFEKMEETMTRYEKFFRWHVGGANPEILKCHEDVRQSFEGSYQINDGYARNDSTGYNMLAAAHSIDRQVVNYAKTVFDLQGTALSV